MEKIRSKSDESVNIDDSSTADLTNNNRAEADGKGDGYDPFAERKIPHPTSDAGALAHLLKCSLGSGILAMPNAFNNGGLAFGAVGTVLVGLLCTHTVHILVKSSHLVCRKAKRPSLTFAETGEQAFATGPPALRKYAPFAKIFVNGALVATYYGALTVYVVFIAESFKLVYNYYVDESSQLDIRIWIAVLLLPLSGLCLIRDLKYLVPFSWIANVFILVGFCVTLYYMAVDMKSPVGLPMVGDVGTLPLFFSTVIFAMEGIGVIMPVENNMKNPGRFLGCPGILNIAMFVVISLYAVIGFCGYMSYGNCTKASVTFNLPDEVMAHVVKILIALAIMFTYPLQFYIGTEIILGLLVHLIPKEKFNIFQNIYRVIIVSLTVAISAAVPNLGPIISLVGAICFSTLGLFVPAVIETVVCYDGQLGRGRWRLYKNVFIGALAILALIFGTYASILEIIETYTSEESDENESCIDIRVRNSSLVLLFHR